MTDIREAALAAAEVHDADIYFYSGAIDDAGFGALASAVTSCLESGRRRAILILVTNGGSAGAGYQIARFLQKTYDEFWLCCPSRCKSAGTLIALGASRLIMDSFSELGPLDVQLLKEDEIGSRKSGLLASATFDALGDEAFRLYSQLMLKIKVASDSLVSFRLASQLAAGMATDLLSQVYGQISPDIVGSERRDLEVAIHYGDRLGAIGGNINGHTVEHLVKHYPSHDFIIDDDEARNWFNTVEVPSAELYALISRIGPASYDEAERSIVCPLTPTEGFSDEDEDDEGDENDQNHHEDDGADADGGGAPPLGNGRSPDRPSDPSEAGAPVSRRASAQSGAGVHGDDASIVPIRQPKGTTN